MNSLKYRWIWLFGDRSYNEYNFVVRTEDLISIHQLEVFVLSVWHRNVDRRTSMRNIVDVGAAVRLRSVAVVKGFAETRWVGQSGLLALWLFVNPCMESDENQWIFYPIHVANVFFGPEIKRMQFFVFLVVRLLASPGLILQGFKWTFLGPDGSFPEPLDYSQIGKDRTTCLCGALKTM